MKKIIVANWKMNPASWIEARKMFLALKQGIGQAGKNEVVICPPFVYLAQAMETFKASKINIGAQNCFWGGQGAYTGQVSVAMLKSLKARYVILGHSESRALGEDNALINQKIKTVLSIGLTPIVCFGETAQQKQNNETFLILEQQVREVLHKIPSNQISKIILAYEPVWAIGGGQSCPVDMALSAALFIKKIIAQIANPAVARKVSLLYGGSVDLSNGDDYFKAEVFSGLLVGAASLRVKEFLKIASIV
ncbi:MAG: triose-phosphate isomerase [Patescibacteria group bacterium]